MRTKAQDVQVRPSSRLNADIPETKSKGKATFISSDPTVSSGSKLFKKSTKDFVQNPAKTLLTHSPAKQTQITEIGTSQIFNEEKLKKAEIVDVSHQKQEWTEEKTGPGISPYKKETQKQPEPKKQVPKPAPAKTDRKPSPKKNSYEEQQNRMLQNV
jgi:hypothetical protein